MIGKTVLMLVLFFAPLIIINTGVVTSPLPLFLLYICCGFGMAGIGMDIMHDANHGSYSKNRTVNRYLGYTMNLVGANTTVWKIQHNELHHTYTNIAEADDDLNAPFFLRFSPHAKRYWVHRFQFLYAWIFYCMATLSWITTKDFVRIIRYRKMGFLHRKNEFRNEMAKLVLWKLFYYFYALVLPLLIVPLAPWIIILAFICMHLVTGFLISTIFQIAHIMPDTLFPLPDKNGTMEDDWFRHQLATTTNFAPKSSIISWFIGGLNHQIEHHLLPGICHIHYQDLSGIVAETVKEFGMPYHIKKTFGAAIWDHIKMLQQLGKMRPKLR